jgi:hypothetical protein
MRHGCNLQYILLRIGRLTTRFSYFDNKKVSKMEARASREALRSRYKIFMLEAEADTRIVC